MSKLGKRVKKYTVNPIIVSLGKKFEAKHFCKEPIFIVASPRSGTTLLLSLLGAHPNIFAIPQQTYAFDKWDEVKGKDYKYYPRRLDRLYRQFLFYKVDENTDRWLEKTPRHIENITKIVDFLDGKVKIIHLIRDGRDVVVSKHPKHRPDEYWVSPTRWKESVAPAWELRDEPFIHTLFYEDLVNDHFKCIKNICDFINEPVVPELKDWIEKTNVKRSKHWREGVRQVNAKAVGKWQKPEHKNRIAEFLNDEEAVALMKKLGYLT